MLRFRVPLDAISDVNYSVLRVNSGPLSLPSSTADHVVTDQRAQYRRCAALGDEVVEVRGEVR